MSTKKPLLFILVLLVAVFQALALPSVSLPASLRPGEPLLVWVRDSKAIKDGRVELRGPTGNLVDSTLLFEGRQGDGEGRADARLYGALFALPMDAKPGLYRVVVIGSQMVSDAAPRPPVVEGSVPTSLASALDASSAALAADTAMQAFRIELSLGVKTRAFPSEDIALDQGNTRLLTSPDPRRDAEAKALHALLAQVDQEAVYLDQSFLLPVEVTRRTANFGDRRRYLYANGGSQTSVHAGIDFAVARNTPVRACAAGRVVYSGLRMVTGNTVVVEHLPGLYSVYMHLEEAKIVQGQLLARGEILGLSGSTGLSTGPHLHWELRLRDQPVDPDFWVSSPPLDKSPPVVKMNGAIEGG